MLGSDEFGGSGGRSRASCLGNFLRGWARSAGEDSLGGGHARGGRRCGGYSRLSVSLGRRRGLAGSPGRCGGHLIRLLSIVRGTKGQNDLSGARARGAPCAGWSGKASFGRLSREPPRQKEIQRRAFRMFRMRPFQHMGQSHAEQGHCKERPTAMAPLHMRG